MRVRPPRLHTLLNAEILRDLYANMRLRDVAKSLGCSTSTVLRALRYHDIPTRPRGSWARRKLHDLDVVEIRSRVRQGEQMNVLVREFSVSRQTLDAIVTGTTWRAHNGETTMHKRHDYISDSGVATDEFETQGSSSAPRSTCSIDGPGRDQGILSDT